ncbi:methyltransferase domain-containing protein [Chlorobium phaeovibrioides]|uniref:Methyltransferase domain-containing protein n=1 Tax=Chlorobium phaeovibrioides TaxID=1094 RepID=A0A3S0L5T4_CHLPH|nr:methionine biosynthesis protein MetW [Chlorobium phaeovibrioides]RTY38377.1 methyltransferase domain-containing protein [Chlorobium phaeovibrioides]
MNIISPLKELVLQVVTTPSFNAESWSYDDYWLKKRGVSMGVANEYQLDRARWIAGVVKPGDSVLDLGCGDGAVLIALRELVAVEVSGADISDYALSHLGDNGIHALKCDLSDPAALKTLPQVDHILLLETLEHLPQPEELLLNVMAKARKSVIFSVPNTGYISYRLRMLFGRFPVQWRVNPGEHLRFWTWRDLHWWLGELGLLKGSRINAYQGIPVLNRIWPALFGAALIARVEVA